MDSPADISAIHAHHALCPGGWQADVRVVIAAGRIHSIASGVAPHPGDHRVGALLPAIPNLHSHTFQRAMAGMTEARGPGSDSFWTWRDLMYRFLEHLTPDDIEAIAALAFVEMLEAGFGSVAEFHYVHHQKGGAPYANLAETSHRVIAAAEATGIGLTLLPVFYCHGGLQQQHLQGGQLRFGNALDRFEQLHGSLAHGLADASADFRLGVAPHSLRAVDASSLAKLASTHAAQPFHIHIAEQQREVDDVKAAYGTTPVAWLLANAPVSDNWCLIHATHMTPDETTALAATRAVAGLCPITESNLGDGIFDGARYQQANGRFGVGSDSNVSISAPLELATLEYSQRLLHQQRNVMAMGQPSTGETLYRAAAAGGAQALARNCGRLETGMLADLVALDLDHLTLATLKPEQLVDGFVFAHTHGMITDVWSAGRHCVKDGVHMSRDRVTANYRSTLLRLRDLL